LANNTLKDGFSSSVGFGEIHSLVNSPYPTIGVNGDKCDQSSFGSSASAFRFALFSMWV
jgi:hypothetical protein